MQAKSKYLGYSKGTVRFEVVLEACAKNLRLLVDVGCRPPQRLLEYDPSMPGIKITKAQWDELELAGVDVPCNENRTWPQQGPKEFCVDYVGGRSSHGKWVTSATTGRASNVCAFCGRPPHATPADPEGKMPEAKKRKRGNRNEKRSG